ncbi:MAG: hypothetical protein CMJ49_13485 [Planctomycetaceae bacterium]|nr:hypothetical protein [Planctomycetaceae bacterium]
MITTAFILARDTPPQKFPFEVIWLWLVLGAVIVVCGLGLWWYQRRMRRDSESTYNGFTLDQLRQLNARGELTNEEYQQMRRAVIASMQSSDPMMRPDDAPQSAPNNADSDR